MRFTLRSTSLLVIGLVLTGCGREPAGNGPAASQPKATKNLPTVTLKIPGMTWPVGWPRRVRAALATLPWVEQDSVTADVGTRIASFAVKDTSQFNLEQVKEALKEQSFPEVELISGPDAPAAKDSPSDKGKPIPKGAAVPAKTEEIKPAASKSSGDSSSGKTSRVTPANSGKSKSQL